MRKFTYIFISLMFFITLSACSSEETLEDLLEKLDTADSYTVHTRMSRALVGPFESFEYVEGNKRYVIAGGVQTDQIEEEYYIYEDDEGNIYFYQRDHTGQWRKELIEDIPPEETEEADDFISMSADWFTKDNGVYILKSEYYDQFFQESDAYITELEIEIEGGSLYMTYTLADPEGYSIRINTSIINIGETTVELPFE